MSNELAKSTTLRKASINLSIVATVIVAIGLVLQLVLSPQLGLYDKIYDLGWILTIIGVLILLKGLVGLLHSLKRNREIIRSKGELKRKLMNNAIFVVLGFLIIIIIIIQPKFMKMDVVYNILAQASTKLILALGVCFTLLIAGTDLSAGRMVGLAAVISASLLQETSYPGRFFPDMPHLFIPWPILLAILACVIFGFINGFLVAKFDMHPFIATLAVQVMVYGAVSLYFSMPPNNSQPLGGFRQDFTNLAGKLFNTEISRLIPIAVVITILCWFILNKTNFGKNIYAIGGNREAAVVCGVNVFWTIMFIFIFASSLYGVAGVLEAARTAGATNNYGLGYELDGIAACVVGGVSLNGGVGTVSGIISGVLIFQVIQVGLQFLGVDPMWQQIIKGVIIAVAVAIDMAKYKRK